MRKNALYIGLVLMSLSFFRCTKAVIDENVEPVEPDNLPASAVYNNDVKDIMFNYCVTCHGGTAPSAGLNLSTYAAVRQATEFGTLQQRMNSTTSPMPASGMLSQDLRAIIDKWVQDGYPEN